MSTGCHGTVLDAVLGVGQPTVYDPSVVGAFADVAEQVRVANEPPDNAALLGRCTLVGPACRVASPWR